MGAFVPGTAAGAETDGSQILPTVEFGCRGPVPAYFASDDSLEWCTLCGLKRGSRRLKPGSVLQLNWRFHGNKLPLVVAREATEAYWGRIFHRLGVGSDLAGFMYIFPRKSMREMKQFSFSKQRSVYFNWPWVPRARVYFVISGLARISWTGRRSKVYGGHWVERRMTTFSGDSEFVSA